MSAAANAQNAAMAQNMAMAQLQGLSGGGINPLLAAQAASLQNPLSLLAAQAAFNPLIASTSAATSSGIGNNISSQPTTLSGGPGTNSLLAASMAAQAASGNIGGGITGIGGSISGKQYSLFVFHLPE